MSTLQPFITIESRLENRNVSMTRTRSGKNDLQTIIQKINTGEMLATVVQKMKPVVNIKFLEAKSGIYAIARTINATYIMLPGSTLNLPDTQVHFSGGISQPELCTNKIDKTMHVIHTQQVTQQAMILGAGLASRFEPVSGDVTGYPKPGVPLVGDDSVIVTLARHLYKHGVRKLLVNTYYKSEVLKQQLSQLPDIAVSYIDEEVPSGTAGGLVKALEAGLVDNTQPILVMQGDSVTDANLSYLIDCHHRQKSKVTLGVKTMPDEEVNQVAIVTTDQSDPDEQSGFIQTYKEKPALHEIGSNRLGSIGFYVLAPEVYELFLAWGLSKRNEKQEFDYAMDFFPRLLTEQPNAMYACLIPEPFYWSDIGKPEQYLQTSRDIYAGKLRVELPEKSGNYCHDNVIYWGNARMKSFEDRAEPQGNIIVISHSR